MNTAVSLIIQVAAVLLTAVLAAPAQNFGGLLTGPNGGPYTYVSEIDRRREVERQRKYAERVQREQQRDREREEEKERLRANKFHYVPKDPQEDFLVMNVNQGALTPDKIVDKMVVQQAAAPAANIPAPREGYRMVAVGDDIYFEKDAAFFIDMAGEMAPVPAPPGALLTKLPPGFQTVDRDGTRYYTASGNWFVRVLVGGTAAFKAVPPPAG